MGESSKGGGEPALCWRAEVDQSLKRLHSLLFGVDHFLDKRDFESAQLLGLRLLGFIDSCSLSDADLQLARSIRREVASKVDAARRALVPDSDRRAFELANRDPGCAFSGKEFDIEKIKESKYFQVLVQQCNGRVTNEVGEQWNKQNKFITKASKAITQTKLTSLYGNNFGSTSNSISNSSLNHHNEGADDCSLVGRAHSCSTYPKGHGSPIFLKVEENERGNVNSLGTKRAHVDISSPINVSVRSLNDEEANADVPGNGFVTARAKLMDSRQKRGLAGSPGASLSPQCDNNASIKGSGVRSYGYSRRLARGNFVPPIKSNGGNVGNMTSRVAGKGDDGLDDSTRRVLEMLCGPDGELPEKLRNLEPRLIEHVSNEIMDRDPNVRWDDIAGLEHAKKCVTEMVIWPLLRPDIFRGCRSPGRGLLLFGPPGTGKTMIGKAIAGEAKATFFYISASSLTSKWIGEGEKLVRALFGVASCRQPAVIFVDEIDSLLSQRKSEGEHESSRRLKTQFLIEMEGFDSGNEQILLIGATNRPQELDEAARRRLTKRLYIPLPSSEARAWIIRNLLEKDGLFTLSKEDIDAICRLTDGYSGSDMKNLVKDASMGPLREALRHGIEITQLKKEDMRPVNLQDFENGLQEVRPSVSLNELGIYEEWNKQFGSLAL
ncbi:ATPase family AAA domain-containing protein FIGL1 isoform X2 [Carica papaya]|uniref:ATPase family AAA domain-containing protein FIGL1 isoform X2 n=1 Tax=Carica papaya TaxID=3649 RepID=UPI000B8CF850|nr:ATPase family AAA domain-containing protein FIGL1 isoform X2 [Carica papaya]